MKKNNIKIAIEILTWIRSNAYSLLIFGILLVIQLPWIDFNGLTSKDTLEYANVAEEWFMSPYIHFRPLAYPTLIFVSKLFSTAYPFGLLIHVQITAYAFSGVLFYHLLQNERIFRGQQRKKVILVITLIAFLSPQVLAFNNVVLPENIPLLFILFIVYLYLKPYSLINSILLSLLIVICILFKPIWLILFILPIIKVLYSHESLQVRTKGILTQLLLITIFYSLHQSITAKHIPNKLSASTLDVNLNLILIRMGKIEGSESTTLHRFLNQNNLIYSIQKRSWTNETDEFNKFTQLKNSIPWAYREDPMFWKSILRNKPLDFMHVIVFQCSRLPAFLTTSPESNIVNFKITSVNKIHQGLYKFLHQFYISIPLLLMFIYMTCFHKTKRLNANKIIIAITLPTALLITVLTYQDSHFLRMRSSLEPFIVYMIIYSLYFIIQKIESKLNPIMLQINILNNINREKQ